MAGKKNTPLSTAELGLTMRLSYNLMPDVSTEVVNEELLDAMRQALEDVSRQRLRSILILFRRQANQDNCLALKDLLNILTDNKVKLKSRTTRLLQNRFTKKHGLDYEGLWKLMVEAQSRTGRDSVVATYGNREEYASTSSPLNSSFSDVQDRELLGKLHQDLKTSDGYDLQEMRASCKSSDTNHHGLIPKKKLRTICNKHQLPVTGPLLNNLMRRCDDEKNGQISWPEFMNFLEKAVNFNIDHDPNKSSRLKSAAVSQKAIPLSDSTNSENSKTQSSNNTKADSSKIEKGNKQKDNKALLKKQKSVTFNASTSNQQPDGTGVGHNGEIMGDEAMEEAYLRNEQRRISEPLNKSSAATDGTMEDEAETSLNTSDKASSSLNASDKAGSSPSAPDKAGSSLNASDKVSNSSSGGSIKLRKDPDGEPQLPSPPTTAPGGLAKKPPTKSAASRAQSGKAKPASSSRPVSRGNPRSAKKTKVAASPKRPGTSSSKSKGKVAVAEKVEKDGKKSTMISQDSTLTTSAITTTIKEGEVMNGDGDLTMKSTEGEVPNADGEQITKSAEGDASETETAGSNSEQTPSETSTTLVKSASIPSIASTQISNVSQDSDSRGSSQGQSVAATTTSQSSQDSESQISVPASDQPLLPNHKASGKPQAQDSRSVLSFMSSGTGGGDGKKRGGSSLMRSFKSFLNIGKRDEEGEEYDEEIEEMIDDDEEEDELLLIDGDSDAESKEQEEKEGEENQAYQNGERDESEEKKKKDEEEEEEQLKLRVTVQGKEVTYYRPDAYAKTNIISDPPEEKLQLDWVYGYRGNDCRGNLFEVSNGDEILYFMSNIAIMYNAKLNKQRHYTQHTAEIRSMTMHSDVVTVATGQGKGPEDSEVKACIHLWKVDTLETLRILDSDFENAVTGLAFSLHQDYLLAVNNSNKTVTMSVWNFKSGDNIASTLVNVPVVCQASFHPKESDQLISIGREHLAFWKLKTSEEGTNAIEQTMSGNYENNMKAKYVISMSFKANGDLLTGDSNGTIFVWPAGGNTISHTISHAHEGPVFTLQMLGKTLVSGGRDGFMRCWVLAGKGADSTGIFQIPKQDGGIRTILHMGSMVYMGTTVNSLLSVALKDTTFALQGDESSVCVSQGHYEEVHCLTTLPNGQFLTGSYDGTVSLFDASDHRHLWRHVVKGTNIHCLDVHLDSGMVALGTKDANLVILSLGQAAEEAETNRFKLGKGAALCLKISPDGEFIAVGCQDNLILVIRVYNKGSTLEMIGKFSGHSGPITGLDWSRDKVGAESGYLVQSSSDQMDYFIWNSQSFEAIVNHVEVHNTAWASQQCLLGFHVAGIWGKEEGGRQLVSADICQGERHLVAVGGAAGKIRLFRYPCCHSEARCQRTSAHPHCAVCVRFAQDKEKTLLSAGSKDYTIYQWKVIASSSSH